METKHPYILLCAKACRSTRSVSRDTVFQEIRQGDGFETGDFAEETSGGLRCKTNLKLLFPDVIKFKACIFDTKSIIYRGADALTVVGCNRLYRVFVRSSLLFRIG